MDAAARARTVGARRTALPRGHDHARRALPQVSQARVLTRPLGGSSLAELAARADGSAFFPQRPQSVQAWRTRMEDVRSRTPVDWLGTLGPAIGANSAVRERLERVA